MIYKLVNWKRSRTRPQFSQSFKTFSKNIAHNYIYYLAQFNNLMIYDTKKHVTKCTLSKVLILVMASHTLQLMEWLEIQNIEYLKNRA